MLKIYSQPLGEVNPNEICETRASPFDVYAIDEALKRYLRDYDEVDSRLFCLINLLNNI